LNPEKLNLIIDIGNSQTKVAIFDAGKIVEIICMESLNISQLGDLKHNYPALSQAILSSVGEVDVELLKVLKKDFD